jgi:hypothetical protein
MAMADMEIGPTLYVDLDGTLIQGDTLKISLCWLARNRPWALGLPILCLWQGRVPFKRRIANCWIPEAHRLPYNPEVIEFLSHIRSQGRSLVLATAADMRIARAVANHLGLFDAIIACDRSINAKGAGKLAAILAHSQGQPFDYMGDSRADLVIFAQCRRSYLVNPTDAVFRAGSQQCNIERVFRSPSKSFSTG